MDTPSLRNFRVENNVKLADGIFELCLAPADQEPLFGFSAGQFVMLHLLNADQSVWAKAAYSMASAPSESAEAIKLAIKVRGDLTKRARDLQSGDFVKVQGPYGKFILPDEDRHIVMLAGGIGIAPFRSMIREAMSSKPDQKITLLYSCKTAEGMAYLDELKQLGSLNANFKPVFSLTGYAPQGWEGETGRIGTKLLHKHVPEVQNVIFMVCGTREFVSDMADMLKKCGVDATMNLHKEMF